MKRTQHGAVLIELALILPMLLLMAFITTEFGRAMFHYNTIAKSVRDASRYLSFQTPGTQITEAKNLVVYGNIAGTGAPLVPGLAVANVSIPPTQTAGSNPVINIVTVTVSGFQFTPLYASVFGIAFAKAAGKIPFSDISASMRAPI